MVEIRSIAAFQPPAWSIGPTNPPAWRQAWPQIIIFVALGVSAVAAAIAYPLTFCDIFNLT